MFADSSLSSVLMAVELFSVAWEADAFADGFLSSNLMVPFDSEVSDGY